MNKYAWEDGEEQEKGERVGGQTALSARGPKQAGVSAKKKKRN